MAQQFPPPTLNQLLTSLTTASTPHLPTPHPQFITPLLSSSRQLHLAALTATARHRISASDISLPHILDPSTARLPQNISDKTIPHTVLAQDIFVQVLDIEDIGRSKWEQVETLESVRKGEMTKGREIIRVVNVESEDPSSASTQPIGTQNQSQVQNTASKGPHKLLLQDHAGTKVWAFELKRVEKIGYPPTMGIGCKLWLKKGAQVARGLVLLEPNVVQVVGGRIENFDTKWKEGREERLRARVMRENPTPPAAGRSEA